MQGKLSEIDIRSILQLIELGQRTGELFVEAYPSQSVSVGDSIATQLSDPRILQPFVEQIWFVFFFNGQIIYAADTDTSLSRLRDYLRRYEAESALSRLTARSIASTSALEYGYLWALLENHILTPAQGRNIIQGMVHETLFDLLSLHQGSFIFELGSPLSPQLTTLEIAPLLARTMKQVQIWKQLHPYVHSPEQCPVIVNRESLKKTLSNRTLNKLAGFVDGKTSIRQIARYLNRDILTVAKAIYPYVEQGVLQLIHPSPDGQSRGTPTKSTRSDELKFLQEVRNPKILCIDDGDTVRETVRSILSQHGYEVIAIGNPLEALSLVFRLNPDLILCDIAMPELDGYEICAMLRKSSVFRRTPLVMLTGKDGFIDRVRARMVGATDYLTKPFGESELLMLVEKYIGSGYPERQQVGQIVENLKDGSESDRTDATSTSSTPLD